MSNIIGPSYKWSARFNVLRAYATATISPGAITTGSSATGTVTVGGDGAAIGDLVDLAPGTNMGGLVFSAHISAANTITWAIANNTGSTVTPASSTWTFYVFYQADGAGVGI